MKLSRTDEPRWFDVQYEKLPYFCFSCGLIGHSEMDCQTPALRNNLGKLSYQTQLPLQAPEERRRKLQSFAEAAADSYGSGSFSNSKNSRDPTGRPPRRQTGLGGEPWHSQGQDDEEPDKEAEDDALSPMRSRSGDTARASKEHVGAAVN